MTRAGRAESGRAESGRRRGVERAAESAQGAARRAAGSRPMRAAARAGLVARGVMYVLIGVLAVQVAFGGGGHADSGGAVAELAGHRFGAVALWLLAAGFAGLAVWRVAEVAFGSAGPDDHAVLTRLKSLGRAVVYGFLAVSLVLFVVGASGRAASNSDSQSQALTARVMSHAGGRVLVIVAGLVGIAVGAVLVYRSVRADVADKLDLTGTGRRTRVAVRALGRFGGVARGVVVAGVGTFLLIAAIRFDPSRAQGVDGTLRAFAGTPLGPYLLVLVAAGLVAFGAYSWCEARWRPADNSGLR